MDVAADKISPSDKVTVINCIKQTVYVVISLTPREHRVACDEICFCHERDLRQQRDPFDKHPEVGRHLKIVVERHDRLAHRLREGSVVLEHKYSCNNRTRTIDSSREY